MTNQMRPGIEHTRVASGAAMRARNASRDPDAEARGLRADVPPPAEPSPEEHAEAPQVEVPQPPADRPDS
jgi:hypothetical protein